MLAACLAAGGPAAGCGDQGVDKEKWLAQNRAIMNRLPLYPSARLEASFAKGDPTGNESPDEGGPNTSFWSTRQYGLVAAVIPEDVLRFYRRELEPEWTPGDHAPCSYSWHRGEASLNVDACYPAGFALHVNHDPIPDG